MPWGKLFLVEFIKLAVCELADAVRRYRARKKIAADKAKAAKSAKTKNTAAPKNRDVRPIPENPYK